MRKRTSKRRQIVSKTGYAETVLVRYDKTKVSLPFIIDMYLKVVDPYSINRQGGDTDPDIS